MGYGPWGCKESDTNELRTHTHTRESALRKCFTARSLYDKHSGMKYIHIYTYISHTETHLYLTQIYNIEYYMYVYIYTCICVYVYVHIYIHVYMYMYMYMYIYIHVYICIICMYIYICIYIHTDIFLYNVICRHHPWWLSGKESLCQHKRCKFIPWVGKISGRRK